SAYAVFAPRSGWPAIGMLGMITCFILLSFYSVVGGWILLFIYETLVGNLSGLSEAEYGAFFDNTIANSGLALGSQFLFMIIAIVVVARGVQKGIEKASKIMMPALFIAFIILIIRSLTLDNVMEGLTFFLYTDFSNMDSETILYALGQSFFYICISVAVKVIYSSYLSEKENLMKSDITIVTITILISFLAGLVIVPAVFALYLEPDAGTCLVFVVVLAVFNHIPFGAFFLLLFL